MFDFEYHLKNLPDKAGVYIMKNSLGEVIYVGKAKILKNRVRQYFQKSKNHSEKVKAMVKNIAEFEYIITDSERSEEHTSELQSRQYLVCRLLLEKKNNIV